MDFEELIDNLKGISDKYTIIGGFIDIHATEGSDLYHIKEVDCYWTIIGKADNKQIEECLKDTEYKVEKEGCYKFDMVLKYESPEYGDYGRPISGGYWYIEYSKFELDHTFEQRERDSKLCDLLDCDLDDLFKI
jgi:hypothetical protein